MSDPSLVDKPCPDEKQETRIHDPGKKFKKYVSTTTTHGVKHVFSGRSKVRRLFWAILFLGSISGCLYGIVASIIAFTRIPTSTTVYTDHVTVLAFPAVTVCNLNGYNLSYLNERSLYKMVEVSLFPDSKEQDELIEKCYDTNSSIKEASLFNMVKQANQSLTDLIVDCRFLGIPCDMESMFTPYVTSLGICYTFNGKNLLKKYLTVNGSGFRHDLQLVLNVRQSEFLGSPYHEVGALVSVHIPEAPPLVWEKGVLVPVGHTAYMALTHSQIEDITYRDSSRNLDCVNSKQTPMLDFLKSYDYSYAACREECTTQDIVNKCNCTSSSTIPHSLNYPECTVSDLCCIYNVIRFPSECLCPVLCNHTLYTVTPSYSTLKYNTLTKKYNISTREELETNFLQIHLYYDELSIHREITERSYSLTKLIANFGGSMGLFLGASIISLTELIVLLVDAVKDRIRNEYNQTSQRHYHRLKTPLSSDENTHPGASDYTAYVDDVKTRTGDVRSCDS